MAIWAIILIGVLIVVLIILVVMTASKRTTNVESQQNNIIYPFSARLMPSNYFYHTEKNPTNVGVGEKPEDGLFLVGMVGGNSADVPQIQCPAGTKINIIGAFVEVDDPYGTCRNTPNPTMTLSCGDDSNISAAAQMITAEPDIKR